METPEYGVMPYEYGADRVPAPGSPGKHAPHHEPGVGRPLGEAPHVPRKPARTVTDQRLDRVPLDRERFLLGHPADVEHVGLVPAVLDAELTRLGDDEIGRASCGGRGEVVV